MEVLEKLSKNCHIFYFKGRNFRLFWPLIRESLCRWNLLIVVIRENLWSRKFSKKRIRGILCPEITNHMNINNINSKKIFKCFTRDMEVDMEVGSRHGSLLPYPWFYNFFSQCLSIFKRDHIRKLMFTYFIKTNCGCESLCLSEYLKFGHA